MTDPTFQATLGGGPHAWHLFVVLPGPVDDWPVKELTGGAIPTPAARAAALTELGFELADDADWHWSEHAADDGSVTLLAGHTVRRLPQS